MADLIEFGEGTPMAAPPSMPQTAKASSPEELLNNFDPLLGTPGPSSSSTSPGSNASGASLGLPKEVAAAFADNNGQGSRTSSGGAEEWLASGLSVQGQAELMKQIEESAKKMHKEGEEAAPALDSLKSTEGQ